MTFAIHIPRAVRVLFEEGARSCAECIDLAVQVNDMSLDPQDGESPCREAALFAERLANVVAHDRYHPFHRGFVHVLNTGFARLFMRLVDFEASLDLANKINRGSHPAFATIHGERGVDRIVEIENSDPPIALPASAYGDDLQDVNIDPIDLEPRNIFDMPELLEQPIGATNDVLLERGSRAATAMIWSAGALMRLHRVDAGKLTFMEYGPRVSVGAMLLAARMGMQVAWRELFPQAYMHTSHQLQRLPREIADRISFVPKDEPRPASLALWNMPWRNTPFYMLGGGLDMGGIFMIQSEWNPGSYRQYWRQFLDVSLARGEYIFPTSFIHMNPSVFQIWCSMG